MDISCAGRFKPPPGRDLGLRVQTRDMQRDARPSLVRMAVPDGLARIQPSFQRVQRIQPGLCDADAQTKRKSTVDFWSVSSFLPRPRAYLWHSLQWETERGKPSIRSVPGDLYGRSDRAPRCPDGKPRRKPQTKSRQDVHGRCESDSFISLSQSARASPPRYYCYSSPGHSLLSTISTHCVHLTPQGPCCSR